jgi:germination protein M
MGIRLVFLVAVVLAAGSLGVLAASCGADEPQSGGPVPSKTDTGSGSGSAPATTGETSGSTTTTEPPPTTTETRTVTVQAWFARSELEGRSPGDPKLFVVHRTIPATEGIGAAAVNELLAGPESIESAADVSTAVPDGTRLLGLNIANGLATVDLSSEFESGGGSLSMQMRLAQVVYTLTQFPTVKRVQFQLDGEPVRVFSGEGILLEKPVTRGDYEELLPAILVATPAIGEEISESVNISGNSNVFEANVTAQVVTASGKKLARDFTTATCGTGCRGDYSLTLAFKAQPAGSSGFVVVQDDDAAGQGFPPHQVRIPIVFG